MDRSLRTIAVLGALTLLGACLQVAPRSSVPFQATADREARYAAETTLAIKEDRRVSEAAANARMVLPQLPEVWGPPRGLPRARQAALEHGPLASAAASDPASIGCAGLQGGPPADAALTDCRPGRRDRTLILPPSGYASILPAAAPTIPEAIEDSFDPESRPSG